MNAVLPFVAAGSRFNAADLQMSLVRTNSMAPAVPMDSLVFLGPALTPRDRVLETLYSIASPSGTHDGNLRRVSVIGPGRYSLRADGAPFRDEITREELTNPRGDVRRVLGACIPYDYEFGMWMREHFDRSAR
jgi:hypothetical protein